MALTKIGILRNFLSTGIDDNANALALTLDTDENATFANGVTASSFSGDGSALTGLPGGGISYVTKTANYTASNDEGIIADTSGGSFTVTLPASPSAGDQVYIADPANWSTNNLTVARNGSTIEGASEDFTVDIGGIIVGFLYDGSTWQVYPQSGFASYQSLDSVLTIGSTTSQSLTVGELTVSGNLQVDGTTTTINSTTLTVDDKNIVLASGAADAAAADGSGITIDGASATLTYGSTNDAWSFNKHLGIGVANPAQRLDVREEKTGGGVLVQIYNEDNSDTTTQTAGIAMGPDTRGGTARITAVKENASFATNAGRDVALTFSSVLNNSPTERLRITSGGNVGVGTDVPNRTLTINQTPPTAFGSPMLQVGEATFVASGYYGIGLGYTAASYTNPPTEIAAVSTSSSGGTTADIVFGTRSVTTNTAATERMRIKSDGNVGIGITPSYTLDIQAIASSFNPVRFSGHSSSIDAFLYTDTAYWSIGDTAGYGGNLWGGNKTSNFVHAHTNGSERMRIDSSGKVGIGTDSPPSKLAVVDNGNVQIVVKNPDAPASSKFAQFVLNMGSTYFGASDRSWQLVQRGLSDGTTNFGIQGWNGSVYNEALTIAEDGYIGIGQTPNSLYTGYWGIQVKNSLWFTNDSSFSGFTQNAYYDGTYKYTTTGTATNIRQISGRFDFLTAASGTADTAITWSTPMTITNGGDVGISATTPSAIISSSRIFDIASGGNTTLSVKSTDGVNDRSAILELLSSGNGGSKSIILYGDTDTTPGTQSPLVWQSYHSGVRTERMRIDYTGGLRIGNAGQIFNSIEDEKLSVKNTVNGSAATFEVTDVTGGYPCIYVRDTDSNTGSHYALYFYRTGAVGSITTTTSSTSYNTTSDYRLKENVVSIDNAIDRVKQLSAYRFNFIAEANTTLDGFLAHEVADIIPEAVTGEKDAVKNVFDPESNTTIEVAEYQGMDQSKLVPLLTAALQEAIARIEALETP